MKIDELNSKGLDREWKVTIPASLVNEKISAKYTEISNTAKLPGFRPGKAQRKAKRTSLALYD